MANFTAIYDACVLYPAALRDFLMWIALTRLFDARWTEEIHSEWMRNVLKNYPDITSEQLSRTKNLMNISIKNCLVTNYEIFIPNIELPDPDDCHILAAAICSDASVIVTFNLGDFPKMALLPYGIEALHPDEFILRLINLDFKAVCQAAQRQRNKLKNPPKTVEEYLETLKQQGLPLSTAKLRELCDDI